jgi:endonuclease/exonuclease/phosphatase family metal-dependent hydrolase
MLVVVALSYAAGSVAAPCEDVQLTELQVFTLNLLFSQFDTRDTSLERVAAFIAAHQVHVILLQEVVGGVVAGTQDSSEDLRDKLAARGAPYALRPQLSDRVDDHAQNRRATETTDWQSHSLPIPFPSPPVARRPVRSGRHSAFSTDHLACNGFGLR